MNDNLPQPRITTGGQTTRPGVNCVVAGALGLTKAASRVDRADEVLNRRRRSLCAACPWRPITQVER
jgi:TPP-dependent indolepyruvate ferredoxin oxidoreductase alpha subunit